MTNKNEQMIQTLVPEMQMKARGLIEKGNDYLSKNHPWVGYVIEITQTVRSRYLQAGFFSIGREFDAAKGIWIVVNEKILKTHTLNSKHLEEKLGAGARAFDIGIKNQHCVLEWPSVETMNGKFLWMELAQIAKECGLIPGALWAHNPDWDHYEI